MLGRPGKFGGGTPGKAGAPLGPGGGKGGKPPGGGEKGRPLGGTGGMPLGPGGPSGKGGIGGTPRPAATPGIAWSEGKQSRFVS